ncbi:CYTH and CHAD domain-containing protein [Nitrosomonas sp. Nm166]|uniref:CYTH and CHAD domain-containing protein n=1 Tax=Nitrosomonas sp. Nm166 TaxID=1881054 RepID=UPI0008EAD73F|nr:CYTH and CHAD domain-containing protein [Nitrosomonas sp. Nm166]SFD91926.1 Inorganic triphosphatase YgiF, contains CYTH and CHAD domains [Nitrosomonas sp. Nm166]
MEIELKLALLPRHTGRIRRHPLLSEIAPEQRPLLSIYFDTPKFDLMRRGIALRVRRVDDQWIQTLKAETQSVGALASRPEWEMAITDGSHPDFSVLPHIALDLLDGIKLKRIAPVFTTEFQRITWQVSNHAAHAEVALDTGKIYAGEAYREICEVEIELKSGAPAFLFDIATQLLQQVPLHIEPRSKAERGYLLSGAAKPAPSKAIQPAIHKDQTAAESWNAIVQTALVQTVANIPGFLENAHDIEYLHQLRVALRRLRTGVLLAKSLNQAPPDWDQSLRKSMQALNAARDWDVFLYETLPKLLTTLEKSAENTPIESATLNQMHEVAAHARHRAQALLLKPAFTQLVLDIGYSLLPAFTDAPMQNITLWAEAVLEKRWHSLRKRCHGFARLDPAKRHLARIAAKKMRYIAEAFAPLYGKPAHHFITALSDLQDELGYANDLRIGMQLLQRLSKQSPALSFELGRISGMLEFEITQHTDLSSSMWEELAQSELFWRKKNQGKKAK